MPEHNLLSVSEKDWCTVEESFNAAEAGHSETLFTLSNGYHGMRGTLELVPHYGQRGAFFAGLFDKAPVVWDKLAIAPDWSDLEVAANGVRFDPATCELLSFRRALDTRQGLLFTSIRWSDAKRQRTRYESCRLVHAHHKQRALLWGSVTPENWSGELTLTGGIDAGVANQTWARSCVMTTQHLIADRFEHDDDGIVYEGRTARLNLPLAMRSQLRVDGQAAPEMEHRRQLLRELHRIKAVKGRPVSFVKAVAFQAAPLKKGNPATIVRRELRALVAAGVDATVRDHVEAWAKRWRWADVKIEGSPADQAAVRFNLFHLMQCACEKPSLDASIAAKGLHGEGYDGHVFWDTEIFMLPFFALTDPTVAKSLLLYRYRRLPAAREHARKGGYRGAQFPWQSSVTGEEVTTWEFCDIVEHTAEPYTLDLQHQVTASIALAVNWYRRWSGDEAFYLEYGAQMLIETAQFWASRVSYDAKRHKYVIRNVKCVDEYHKGVDNDAYTCYAAAENLSLGVQAARDLKAYDPARFQQLCREIRLTQEEIGQWSRIAETMYFPMDAETGMIEQFDGYFDLPDETVKYDRDGWPIEPDEPERLYRGETQLIKQADVVLLFYLFGNRFTDAVKRKSFLYYLARDTQGSSLSANAYAIVGLEIGQTDHAYQAFRNSAYRDLRPSEDAAGIHAACLGGTWQAVVNGFAGMRLWGECPSFRPWLPPGWTRLAFTILWRGTRLGIEVTPAAFTARVLKGPPIDIILNGNRLRVARRKINVAMQAESHRID